LDDHVSAIRIGPLDFALKVYHLGRVEDLPNRIRVLRKRRGLTQVELARRLRRDKSTVAHWERGKSRPRRIEDVAAGLDMTVTEFFAAAVS